MGNADDASQSGRKNIRAEGKEFRPGRSGNEPGSTAMTAAEQFQRRIANRKTPPTPALPGHYLERDEVRPLSNVGANSDVWWSDDPARGIKAGDPIRMGTPRYEPYRPEDLGPMPDHSFGAMAKETWSWADYWKELFVGLAVGLPVGLAFIVGIGVLLGLAYLVKGLFSG